MTYWLEQAEAETQARPLPPPSAHAKVPGQDAFCDARSSYFPMRRQAHERDAVSAARAVLQTGSYDVLNLLSNAIKFTPEGGRIEVGAVPKDGFVEVSVSDTGVGIAPGDQEAVFEEFRQVGTAAKKIEGTGLGLTLCRKFVELHGGRIWVKSQLDQGSTFTFTIPVRPGE